MQVLNYVLHAVHSYTEYLYLGSSNLSLPQICLIYLSTGGNSFEHKSNTTQNNYKKEKEKQSLYQSTKTIKKEDQKRNQIINITNN